MENKVYAVTSDTSCKVPYITHGREYPLLEEGPASFHIKDDDGDTILCLWRGCAHLVGGNWTRVERQS